MPVISAWADACHPHRAEQLLMEMRDLMSSLHGVHPKASEYMPVIHAWAMAAEPHRAERLVHSAQKTGVKVTSGNFAPIIHAYGAARLPQQALRIVDHRARADPTDVRCQEHDVRRRPT